MFLEAIKDCPSSQTYLKSRFYLHTSSVLFYLLTCSTRRCQKEAKLERRTHPYTYEDERANTQGAVLPTDLIKACVLSEVAAAKSQPRAHLFKRGNNEFFVASHLPITINLAFCRYTHSDPWASRLGNISTHGRFTACHPKDANCAGVLLSPQLLKNTEKLTCMSSITHSLNTAHSYGYFTKQPFITTPILLSLYCLSLFWY